MAGPLDPDLTWRDGAVPVSGRFGDVYFSAENGLAETRHVFLDGVGAPAAWTGRQHTVVGELGFGTGLNFLATWQRWRETAPPDGRLHFVSVEGFPMPSGDLGRALAAYPELAALAAQLSASLPPRRQGFHHLQFDGSRVSLLLIYDDVRSALTNLQARVDAWFLDGFAPARNPEMWTSEVFGLIAGRSRPDARLATFTVAGAVRRGLSEAGFRVEKRPGFGTKRECLAAVFEGTPAPSGLPAWAQVSEPETPPASVAVVGSGIAGCSVSAALAAAGVTVTLFDENTRAGTGASGTPAGIVQPRPLDDGGPAAAFFAAAARHAERTYDALDGAWAHKGVLVLGRDDADRERYARLPGAQPLDPMAAADAVGMSPGPGGVWFAGGGALNTQGVCAALAASAPGRFGHAIRALSQDGAGWHLTDTAGRAHRADAVVLAGGTATMTLADFPELGLHANRGQISLMEPTSKTAALTAPVTFGGYLTPVADGRHSLGSTFDRAPDWEAGAWRAVRDHDHDRNYNLLDRRLPELAAVLGPLAGGWTGLRATTPDRLPVVEPLPARAAYVRDYADFHHGRSPADGPAPTYRRGLYVLSGLGSRGFLTAPLAAQILAGQIIGTPLPIAADTIPALHPARFLMRALRKGLVG